jgi:hypothetical protein
LPWKEIRQLSKREKVRWVAVFRGRGEGGLPSQTADGSITQSKFSLIPPLYITKKNIKVPD